MLTVCIVETQAQLEACLALRQAVFVEEQHVPPELEVDEWDRLERAIHLCATEEDSGQVLGTARVKHLNFQEAKIQRVAVAQSQRGKGIGSALMQYAAAVLQQKGFHRIVLDAQIAAEPFYRQLGYSRVSDDLFYDAGILHVRMVRNLRG